MATRPAQIYTGSGWDDIGDKRITTNNAIPQASVDGLTTSLASKLDLAGGKILQVVSTAKTGTFTTSSTSMVDVSGLSVSITPSSATSKILVMLDLKLNSRAAVVAGFAQLMRDSTAVYIGDSAGSRARLTGNTVANSEWAAQVSAVFLDNPETTLAITYKVQIRANTSNNVYVNRGDDDTDNSLRGRTASSITAMEVSA